MIKKYGKKIFRRNINKKHYFSRTTKNDEKNTDKSFINKTPAKKNIISNNKGKFKREKNKLTTSGNINVYHYFKRILAYNESEKMNYHMKKL